MNKGKSNKLLIKSKLIKWYSLFFMKEKRSAGDIYTELLITEKIVNHPKFERLIMYDKGQFVVGDNVAIGNGAWIWCHCHCDSGPVNGLGTGSLYIGDNTYIGANFHADCYDYVKIGGDCLIADDVSIISSNHGMNPEQDGSYVKQPFEIGKIKIGDGCWIGSRVTILKGSSIGKRSIIGANSVVTKSIPPYSIAVGSPARVIKKWSFDEHRWVKESG